MDGEAIGRARELLAGADRVAVMTGAGISAESGVPTFRGKEGMWRNHDPMSLATPGAFARDPALVWEWYDWRRELVLRCEPNAAHRALVALEEQKPEFALVTQNVDGLHRRAGSRNVLELHGALFRNVCTACGAEETRFAHGLEGLPRCGACGGMERPGVVWFGEMLPVEAYNRSVMAVASCEVLLVVGTSGVVYPAAGLVDVALQKGAAVVVVNLEVTDHSGVATVALEGRAGEILPQLVGG